MEASDLAVMQEAINTLATMMNAVVEMSGRVRERAVALGVSAEIADLMALETFRSALQITFPNVASL